MKKNIANMFLVATDAVAGQISANGCLNFRLLPYGVGEDDGSKLGPIVPDDSGTRISELAIIIHMVQFAY